MKNKRPKEKKDSTLPKNRNERTNVNHSTDSEYDPLNASFVSIDNTKKLSHHKRRLDALARLLAGYDRLANFSVVVLPMQKKKKIDYQFVIASNNLYTRPERGSSGRKLKRMTALMLKETTYYQSVMNHFHSTAKHKDYPKSKNDTPLSLDIIFAKDRVEILDKGRFALCVHKDSLGTLLTIFKTHSGGDKQLQRGTAVLKMYRGWSQGVKEATLVLYARMERAHKDLLKINNYIRNYTDEKSSESLPPQFLAFANSDHVLALKEEEKDVHGETQLITYIAQKISSDQLEVTDEMKQEGIYLGVSKRCCEKCSQLIKAMNSRLRKNYGVEFIVRGSSAIFYKKWIWPQILEKDFKKDGIILANKISYLELKKKEQQLTNIHDTEVKSSSSDAISSSRKNSSGTTSTIDNTPSQHLDFQPLDEKKDALFHQYQTKIKHWKEFVNDQKPDEKFITIVTLAESLYQNLAFKKIFNDTPLVGLQKSPRHFYIQIITHGTWHEAELD
ncbi:MAG: hypothetical protein JKY13_01495, partial [Gammaproteobacteria bacterium]|nr:hypothetical protein [Gammaproteobacteria bacterium]